MAKGGRAQYLSSRSSVARSCASLIDPAGRVEDDARQGGFTIGHNIARHFLKDPVNHTDV
jgi:hypothetical protein